MPTIIIEDLRQRHIEDFLRARRDVRNGWTALDTDRLMAAILSFAKQLGKADLEADKYSTALREAVQALGRRAERQDQVTAIEEDGIRLRAAIRCGWFGDELTEDDVGDLHGWEVDQLSTAVAERFNEAMTVPKN